MAGICGVSEASMTNLVKSLELAPIKSVGNEIIRIKDISQVVDGIKERESYALSNFKPASYIMVFKEADANTVKSVKEVRKAVDRISKFLPDANIGNGSALTLQMAD